MYGLTYPFGTAVGPSPNIPAGGETVSEATTEEVRHPELSEALAKLADALDRRHDDLPDAPSYLEMAALADRISDQLHDLAKMLVAAARGHDGASWTDVGQAFSVTRQAAMRRWT